MKISRGLVLAVSGALSIVAGVAVAAAADAGDSPKNQNPGIVKPGDGVSCTFRGEVMPREWCMSERPKQ
jgi:hypothetical protein